ncbi:hypothetical protein AYI70_g1855 [Smittium culicis]|uniref:Uncharacterized protein n=1 Tax=Smittium culicis TaxID=133412 RepID=A0A1R1YBJ5_9FUNG|nr:hypothetical protein AYI70_g12077 [Smittium culicis]OMJ24046.1 hypothetical protein AYI70_g1855 [Smittium culicis]
MLSIRYIIAVIALSILALYDFAEKTFQEKEIFQGNESEKEEKESISEKDSEEEFLEGKELAQGIKNILGKESGDEEESIEGKCFCLPLKRNLSYYEVDECNTSCKDGYKLIDIDDFYENAENTIKIIKSNIISIPISVKSIASKICDFSFMQLKFDCSLDKFIEYVQKSLETKKIKDLSGKNKSLIVIKKD